MGFKQSDVHKISFSLRRLRFGAVIMGFHLENDQPGFEGEELCNNRMMIFRTIRGWDDPIKLFSCFFRVTGLTDRSK